MLEYLNIGRIVNTHGVKGEVKILPLTDDQRRYDKLEFLYIEDSSELKKAYIESIKYLKQFVILKLKDINNLQEAEKLREKYVKVHRKDAVLLPEGSFFICDIIGCDVYDENNQKLGEVIDVIKTGSNDVYVVKQMKGQDILIPALKNVVQEISIEKKLIKVVLPEGLI